MFRREFLWGAAAAVAVPMVASCAPSVDPPWQGEPFRHGVASGDPDATSVVLWTRLEPDHGTVDPSVVWEVALDPSFSDVVAASTYRTAAERDWTVKFVVDGLEPATDYHYRFTHPSGQSSTGRTRTTPKGRTDRVRLGVVSCSNYAYGHFYVYRALARRDDLDAVVHLGDYIYEYANPYGGETYGEYRPLDPVHETVTLDDYRRRYALYRRDPDLRAVHEAFPMIHVWDDHEFADDPFLGGAANHQPDQDGAWSDRIAAALRAYDEWMPTRLAGTQIYRRVDFGDLVSLVMVDRQRRFLWPEPDDADLYLGARQFRWLDDQLSDATGRWLVLGSPTTFGSTSPDLNSGGWGERDRSRVFGALDPSTDLIAISGDTHRALALDLVSDRAQYATGSGGSAGAEFSCGSVSSPGSNLSQWNEAVRWNSGLDRSYLVLDIDRTRVAADFWGTFDLAKYLQFETPEQHLGSFVVPHGARRIA